MSCQNDEVDQRDKRGSDIDDTSSFMLSRNTEYNNISKID